MKQLYFLLIVLLFAHRGSAQNANLLTAKVVDAKGLPIELVNVKVTETNQYAAFETEGVNQLKRFKLYGHFSFQRTWDDSLAFNLRGLKNSDQPAYLLAGKAGNYERQTYIGGGIISYELLKDKAYLSTGVDYLYNESAGDVDPRALVTTYRIIFNPEFTYKIKKQVIGVGVNIGYGTENILFNIKNSDFEGTTYPERIPYLNFGYGNIDPSQGDFNRRSKYTGLTLNYAGNVGKLALNTKMSYNVSFDDNYYPLDKSIKYNSFQTFQMESLKLDILIGKKGETIDQQILINFNKDSGSDELVQAGARNYIFNRVDFSSSYNLLIKRYNRRGMEWISNLAYQSVLRRDAASNQSLSYNYFKPRIGHIQYWQGKNNDRLAVGANIFARLPTQTIVVKASQETIFTTGVVYPDYLYWTSKAIGTDFKIDFISNHIIKNFRTGINLSSSYMRSLSYTDTNFNTTFVPSKDFFGINIGLKLFF
ncbi:MAG: hypothetical protein EOO92_04315 [Pedobacter sp.]|nr:MAG: hypothetical protein EOO92_04315 [Pedobacter sp.]